MSAVLWDWRITYLAKDDVHVEDVEHECTVRAPTAADALVMFAAEHPNEFALGPEVKRIRVIEPYDPNHPMPGVTKLRHEAIPETWSDTHQAGTMRPELCR